MNILLIGAPGSGKGTLGKYLAKVGNLDHMSTGELFRFHMNNETEIGKQVKADIAAGGLADNDITIKMIDDYINTSDRKGIIFDGFPRNLQQGLLMEELLVRHQMKLDYIFYLKVSENILIDRLIKRATLENRPEDADLEYSTTRIKLFNESTKPLLDEYKKTRKVHYLDASESIHEVNVQVSTIILRDLLN